MRSLKIFVLIVIITTGFLATLTLFLPSKVTVSKSILIEATGPGVESEIENFENWKKWYPAFQNRNIAIVISKRGDSSLATLIDENQREFSMALVKPEPERIDIFLFEGNKKNVTYQFILSATRTGQTQLTWNINTSFPWYPWEKIRGIFLDKITGPQYQEILQNLKVAVESHQAGAPG